MTSPIGYYPDHDYSLRRMNDDDGLDPVPAYYVLNRDMYRAQQLRSSSLTAGFDGKSIGRVELNNSLKPYRVVNGDDLLGEIELSTGVYTAIDGQRYLMQRIGS